MAHLLNLENVSVIRGPRTVLDGVSLGLDDGARVGVVGRNGDGKSTLLQILCRTLPPTAGRVSWSGGLRVGALVQRDLEPTGTVRDAVLGDRADEGDHIWAADPAVRDVVTGLLGDVERDVVGGWQAPAAVLSGGQGRRVALAAVLIADHDLVVLDEPTNHLDLDAVHWLAGHLGRRWPPGRGGLVVVTHDRWFLDAVCEHTWEVHDGTVDQYDGGYAAYVLARAERSRVASVTEQRRANHVRKELAWLRRGAPARTSKPKFRMDAAAALIATEPPPRDTVELVRTATSRLGKDVIDLEDVTMSVGEGADRRTLLREVTWRLGPGDRFGILGANGSGKTTLLRLLSREVVSDSGRVKRGKTVKLAVLSQHLRELGEVAQLRVAEAIGREGQSFLVGGKPMSAGQLVERLGFTNDRAWTPVSELSGGERRRLQLARLLMREPNVLLLDEPTNDLDTDTLASMEDVLDSFAGTLVVVSHDRYLLERLTDRQVGLLGDGDVRDLPGGVDEYLRLRAAMTYSAAPQDVSTVSREGAPTVGAAQAREAKKTVIRLERQIEQFHTREADLHRQLALWATDHQRLAALAAQLQRLVSQREAAEEQWLEAADQIDRA